MSGHRSLFSPAIVLVIIGELVCSLILAFHGLVVQHRIVTIQFMQNWTICDRVIIKKKQTNKQTIKYKYTQIERLTKLTEHELMDCFSLRGFRALPRFTRVERPNYFILSKEDYDQSSTISTNPPFIGSTRNTYEPGTANALRQCLLSAILGYGLCNQSPT